MAEPNTNRTEHQVEPKPPVRSATSLRFKEPVIISANRFLDIAPYVSNIYEADPMRWGAILPWEFPQYASKEVEEAFIIEWFGEHEVHMQGGATHEGAGFRFLKQVWYTIAIWNWEDRVPKIANWWWTLPANQYLVEDLGTLKALCHPNAKPRTIFTADTLNIYPEKLLGYVVPLIQSFAAAKLEENATTASSLHSTQKSGAKSDSAIDNSVAVELSPRAQSLHDMETSDATSFTDKPSNSSKPDVKIGLDISLNPVSDSHLHQPTQVEKLETEPVASSAVVSGDQSTSPTAASNTKQSSSPVTMQTPLHTQLGSTAAADRPSIEENRTPTHTPLRVDNVVFVPRNPPAGQPQPVSFPTDGFYNQPYGYPMHPQQFLGTFAPYAQDQNDFGAPHGAQSIYPEHTEQRGARGGRRGSRGEGARRMSRGGRDGHPRGRFGSNNFDNTATAIEHYPPPRHLMHPPGNRGPIVPPPMQARHGSYQQPMNIPYNTMGEAFQHQTPHSAPLPEHAMLQHPSHAQRPYISPNVRPSQFQQNVMGAPMLRIPSNISSEDPSSYDVGKDYIGSNRTEVRQLVIFQCPLDLIKEDLEQLFANIGLSDVNIDLRAKNAAPSSDQQYTMAFARFHTHDEARRGLMLNGHQIGQRKLVVEVSKEFWDSNCSRYKSRYRAASQASTTGPSTHGGQQYPPARTERNLTPRTNPYESSNEGNDASAPHRHVSAAAFDREPSSHISASAQTKTRILPTQDARFMDSFRLDQSSAVQTAPLRGAEKEASPKKQKHSKNKKKNQQKLGEAGVVKGIQDKTNQSSDQSGKSEDNSKTRDRQDTGLHIRSAAKHKVNIKEQKEKAESASTEKTSKVVGEKPDAPVGLSPVPAASVELPLKVSKRIAPTPVEGPIAVQSMRSEADDKIGHNSMTIDITGKKQDSPIEVEAGLDKQRIIMTEPRDTSEDTAPVVTKDILGPEPVNKPILLTDSAVDEVLSPPVMAIPKLPGTKKEPSSSAAVLPIRVATPIRAVSFKPTTSDDATQTPTQVVAKKPADVITSSRKVSETSMPPTPASVYTTAPPTPTATEITTTETSKEQTIQKVQEKPKGPSQTESLSMFVKKQSKPKKKDGKGKDTLKEKPKELAKLAEEETTKPMAGAPSSSVEANPKQSKGKQKAQKTTHLMAANTGDDLQQKSGLPPVESPVTSPGKRKLGPLSSLFGLLSRQPTSSAPSPESAAEIGKLTLKDEQAVESVGTSDVKIDLPGKETKTVGSVAEEMKAIDSAAEETKTTDSTAEDTKTTDQVNSQVDCVSQIQEEPTTKPTIHENEVIDKVLAEACKKSFEYSQQASAVLLKPSSVNTTSSLQSLEASSPKVVGLGMSGVPIPSEAQISTKKRRQNSKDKQRAPSTSSSGSGRKLDTPSSSHRDTEAITSGVGSPKPMFERDKAEDEHSQSSRTISAHSTPSNSPPSRLLSRSQQKDHLIEAPQPRNAHKRRVPRPHSTSNHTILVSEDVIPAQSSEQSTVEGSDDEARVNPAETLTLYNLEHQNEPDVFVPAQDSQATLYIIYPPVSTPITTAPPASWEGELGSAAAPSRPYIPFSSSQEESDNEHQLTIPEIPRQLQALKEVEESDGLFVSRTPSLAIDMQEDRTERMQEVDGSDDGMRDVEELGSESD